MGIEYLNYQYGGVFIMGKRVSYPVEVKIRAVEMKYRNDSCTPNN